MDNFHTSLILNYCEEFSCFALQFSFLFPLCFRAVNLAILAKDRKKHKVNVMLDKELTSCQTKC